MARRTGAVHVVTTTRKYNGRVYRTHLLRRSYRDGRQVRNETVGNLSHLPDHVVDLIRRSLRGETLVADRDAFEIIASPHHGHVEAVRLAMKRLGLDGVIASRSGRERDLVVAMVAARILEPQSKLATTRWWHTTTLPELLGVTDADENELYAAMDWLLSRQHHIEKKLAARHLTNGGLVLYDLTSSYFEGSTCPLAAFGHNRDGKKGKLQVNYGLLTDRRGCPVAVSVFAGNTGDPTTLPPQITKVRDTFGIQTVVLVGDRGMISQKQIDDELRTLEGVEWITALKSRAIRKLVDGGHVQLGLFDERNLFEMAHPDYPGERLIACRNPELAKLRAHKRQALLDATTQELETVRSMVERGRLKSADKIGVRVGKVVNKYKMAKHVILEIGDDRFAFRIDAPSVRQEAALDGIYIVRTSVAAHRLSADDAVRRYKSLAHVEQAFRSIKTLDLQVRPIRHQLEDRVRAHIFLCMLAYYVEWHMREAWRPLLFGDEDQHAKHTRDPVAPAQRSSAALDKVASKTLGDGTVVHSFRTLVHDLSTIVRNVCRRKDAAPGEPPFHVVTSPTSKHQRAHDLLDAITV